MSIPLKPIRRVVTGNESRGHWCVVYDSAAPNVNPGGIRPGTGMTDCGCKKNSQRELSRHATTATALGGSRPNTAGTCASCSRRRNILIGSRPRQDRSTACTRRASAQAAPGIKAAPTHSRRPSINRKPLDKGILLEGERVLLLDDIAIRNEPRRRGGSAGQLAVSACNPNQGSLMAFVMMGGKYTD